MFPGFDTYDDGRVLLVTRRRMRRVLVAFGVASCATVLLAPPLAAWFGGGVWVPLVATGSLSLVAMACIHRLGRLRECVWRVAASARHVVTLDVARRQRTIAWGAVQRLDVCDAGVVIVARGLGDEIVTVLVRDSFGPYVAVAHRLVAQAQRRRIPVWVEGQPLVALDVHELFPTLETDLAGKAHS